MTTPTTPPATTDESGRWLRILVAGWPAIAFLGGTLLAHGTTADASTGERESDPEPTAAEALETLLRALVEARVKPYYLHHPDLAREPARSGLAWLTALFPPHPSRHSACRRPWPRCVPSAAIPAPPPAARATRRCRHSRRRPAAHSSPDRPPP